MQPRAPHEGQLLDLAQVFAAADRVSVLAIEDRVRALTDDREDWLWTAALHWRLSGELPEFPVWSGQSPASLATEFDSTLDLFEALAALRPLVSVARPSPDPFISERSA